ncbi:MAG: AAA family ATPase [Candidatus Didemnitutus sp.]|nr:AAA family ATPase [Candidatus Didemnitutus sp.]
MSEPLLIAVFGPESTGKTELATKLAGHFRAPLVLEYAREFWDEHGAIALEDIAPIAREQWRREDAAIANGAPLVICDTEALTTVLWSDLLYGTCPEEVRRIAQKRTRRYALYLLLDSDVAFVADPQRCFPSAEDREKCRRIWRGALESQGLPYVVVSGDWAKREQVAHEAIQRLMRDRA